jgi:hypothetical protein
MQKIIKILILALLVAGFQNSNAQERTNSKNQDEELGKVSWYRDYDAAIAASEKENKPVLILFQEVPGCTTCRNYGHNVLSNPLMTEAIENEFIPLAIFNNKKGKDLIILKKYNEPTWNNPVVRIVNKKGENLVKRVASDYSAKGLYNAMLKALNIEKKAIPEYIKILGQELTINYNAPNIKEAHYKMYCFWTGEKQLGSQDGVLLTQAGFMNGEVVKVKYDASKVSKETLNTFAKANKMQPVTSKNNFTWSEKDEDYYLQHSQLKYLPLSQVQKTKINSALGNSQSPLPYLSPKQKQWLAKLDTNEILYNKDFNTSWNKRMGS